MTLDEFAKRILNPEVERKFGPNAAEKARALLQSGHEERMQAFHDAVLTAAKEARSTGKPVAVGRMLGCPIVVQPPETQE